MEHTLKYVEGFDRCYFHRSVLLSPVPTLKKNPRQDFGCLQGLLGHWAMLVCTSSAISPLASACPLRTWLELAIPNAWVHSSLVIFFLSLNPPTDLPYRHSRKNQHCNKSPCPQGYQYLTSEELKPRRLILQPLSFSNRETKKELFLLDLFDYFSLLPPLFPR